MTPSNDELNISTRDVVILKVRVKNPTVSTRELSDILVETEEGRSYLDEYYDFEECPDDKLPTER